MLLISFMGDQAIVLNNVLKQSVVLARMVKYEYRYQVRIKPKREALKKNYPDARLDISGNYRFH